VPPKIMPAERAVSCHFDPSTCVAASASGVCAAVGRQTNAMSVNMTAIFSEDKTSSF
jgi:hypothetical protein